MKRIKSYKVFESKESVDSICQKYSILNWTLNPDGTVDVDGDVNLFDSGLDELPLKFGRVTGHFICSDNKLTSLEFCPKEVGGDFDCSYNELTSLEFCPKEVGGYFDCSWNRLTNLEGCPNWVGGDFDCSWNNLTNLEGCPEKVWGNLDCRWNKIISLDHYPTILTGQLWTYDNPIWEIWLNVEYNKNNGVLLELFWLNNPIRYENGEWVCYREFLDNFFEEIGVTSPPKLKNYKEV